MPRIGRGSPPLAVVAARGATRRVQHRALEAQEQSQQFGEAGAVQRARRPIRGRVDRERVSYPHDGDVAFPLQLASEHGELQREGYVPVVRIRHTLAINATPDGSACTLYSAGFAELLRLLLGFEGAMLHTSCRATGGDHCEWRAAPPDPRHH